MIQWKRFRSAVFALAVMLVVGTSFAKDLICRLQGIDGFDRESERGKKQFRARQLKISHRVRFMSRGKEALLLAIQFPHQRSGISDKDCHRPAKHRPARDGGEHLLLTGEDGYTPQQERIIKMPQEDQVLPRFIALDEGDS